MFNANNEKSDELVKSGKFVLFLLLSLFLCGMFCGVISFCDTQNLASINNSTAKTAENLIYTYVNNLRTQTIFSSIWKSFSSTLFFIVSAYLLGYSAISQPITLLLLPIKGMGTGFLMSGLYWSFGVKGVLFSALILLPSLLVSIFCILICSRESMALSNIIFGIFMTALHIDRASNNMANRNSQIITAATVKLYHLKMGIVVLIALLGGLLETICFFAFFKPIGL